MLEPYSEFSLIKLNLSLEELLPLFDDLELDNNDKSLYNLTPFRARKILYTKFIDNETYILKNKEFVQSVNDVRKNKRVFKSFEPSKKDHETLNLLLKSLFNFYNLKDNYDVIFHFVKIFALESGSSNSPEGIHRDGFDILVPCLVLERVNIEGGDSRIYDNGELVYKKIINSGEGLLLNEKDYVEMYHDVMPIKLKDASKTGYRTILGIDINLLN